jgi:hypothetical protein
MDLPSYLYSATVYTVLCLPCCLSSPAVLAIGSGFSSPTSVFQPMKVEDLLLCHTKGSPLLHPQAFVKGYILSVMPVTT